LCGGEQGRGRRVVSVGIGSLKLTWVGKAIVLFLLCGGEVELFIYVMLEIYLFIYCVVESNLFIYCVVESRAGRVGLGLLGWVV
jgi:hypothetical protein